MVISQHLTASRSLQSARSGVHNTAAHCQLNMPNAAKVARLRESIMTRTSRGIMLMLSAAGLLTGPPSFSRETSTHVLADVVAGKIKPAQLTVQPAPNSASVTRALPFFSSGPLMAAAAARRRGAGGGGGGGAARGAGARAA